MGSFQVEQPRKQPSGDIDRVADGLRADANPRCCSEFLQTAELAVSWGKEEIVSGAVRRAEIDETIDVVLHASLAEKCVRDEAGAQVAKRKTIRFDGTIDVVRRLSPAPSRHILADDGGISR